MTWKHTWLTISGMDGLILPGMIDDPGCTAGSLISSMPVRGPMTIRRRSLAIFDRSMARPRSVRAERRRVAHALHELDAVLADAQLEARDLAQMLVHQRGILLLDRHAGADGRAADAEVAQVVGRFRHAPQRAVERAGVRRELLAEADGHRVLQVRAARLHDVVELAALLGERVAQALERRRQRPELRQRRRAGCSWGSCRSSTAPC